MTRIRWTWLVLLLWIGGTDVVSPASVMGSDHPAVMPPLPDDDTSIPCNLTDSAACGRDRYCVDLSDTPTKSNSSTQNSATDSLGVCLHKTLQTLSLTDALGLGLIFGACWMAAMAGIGGGGLLFPILTLVMNFDAKQGAVLGNAGVLGNASGQVLWNHVLASKHETSEGTNTVFEVSLLILPTLVAGGSWSLVLVGLVPSTVLLILAVITLLFASTKTYLKANQMRQKERNEEQNASPSFVEDGTSNTEEQITQQQEVDGDNQAVSQGGAESGTDTPSRSVAAEEESGPIRSAYDEALLDLMTSSEENVTSTRCSASLFTKCWIAFFWTLNMATFFTEHFLPKCSPSYFLLLCIPTVSAVLFVFWRWCRHRQLEARTPSADASGNGISNRETPLLASYQTDAAASYVAQQENEMDGIFGDDETDSGTPIQSSLLIPTLSFGIGFLAALLGIGGGELIGPMLLMLGGNNSLDPTVTSSITALLSWLNSASNQVHNMALGRITSISYTILVLLVGFVGGLGGRSWVAAGRDRNKNKSSIIAYSLLAVLCIATSLLVWELVTSHPEWEGNGICQ